MPVVEMKSRFLGFCDLDVMLHFMFSATVFGGILIVFERITLNVCLFDRCFATFKRGIVVVLTVSVRSEKLIIQELSIMKSEPINIVSDKLLTIRTLHSCCTDSGGNPILVVRLPSISSSDPFAPTKLVFPDSREGSILSGRIFLLIRVTGDPESARA